MKVEDKIREFVQGRFADAILKESDFRGDQSLYVPPDCLHGLCEALMSDPELEFSFLADITSIDWIGHTLEAEGRFEVVYNLYSLKNCQRLFLKIRLDGENPSISSLTSLWNGANWMEREVWDLMGIEFVGHPDLTKILTPDELEGHPLRRDFPLTYEVPQFSWNKDDPPEVIK